MNCYNGEEYLRQAIDSVFNQTYQDWEIIFVDNCSTDNSQDIARSYGDKVRIVRTKSNIPLYAARNYGIEHAAGEYVAFLDTDDIWLPDKLLKQIELLTTSLSDVVFTDVETIDSLEKPVKRKLPRKHRGAIVNRLLFRNFIAISSVLMKKNVFATCQFNECYTLVGDYDLWIRLAIKFRFDYVDEKLVQYRVHEKSTTILQKKNWITEIRTHYKMLMKEYGMKIPMVYFYCFKAEISNLIKS